MDLPIILYNMTFQAFDFNVCFYLSFSADVTIYEHGNKQYGAGLDCGRDSMDSKTIY